MKRCWSLVLISTLGLATIAFGRSQGDDVPQRQAAQQPDPNARALQLISDVYVANFRSTIEMSDDQYLKIGNFLREFIRNRFRVANQRVLLNQRRTELLGQSDPSEAEVQRLGNDLAQLERNAANFENNFQTRIATELSPKQVLLVMQFNKTFFEQRLPQLLERARAEAQTRGQQAQPIRPNANKNKNKTTAPAGDTFRNR